MGDTTNIQELPTETNNLPKEIGQIQNTVINKEVSLDENTISQIVSGLQKASSNGATKLPSRDIATTSDQIMNDEEIKPNFVPLPPQAQQDYIPNDEIRYQPPRHTEETVESLFQELQIPIIIGLLYFLFQLPYLKQLLMKYMPFLCSTDGNYNFNGLIFTSVLFSVSFLIYMKGNSLINANFI